MNKNNEKSENGKESILHVIDNGGEQLMKFLLTTTFYFFVAVGTSLVLLMFIVGIAYFVYSYL